MRKQHYRRILLYCLIFLLIIQTGFFFPVYFSEIFTAIPRPFKIITELLLHLLFFLVIGIVLLMNMQPRHAIILGVFLACLDEIMQYYAFVRRFDIIDIFMDCIGILIGVLIFHYFKGLRY